MSTVTLQKLDRDLTTIRLDMNSLQASGTAGIGVVDPVDLGSIIDDEAFLTQAPYPEVYQRSPSRKQVAVRFRLRVKAASRSARLVLLRTLMLELNTPGPYLWKPDASADAIYFDGFAAEFPAELHGQDYSQTMAVTKADDLIEVVLWRMPYLYEARCDSSVNKILNAMMWIDSDEDGTPNSWTKPAGTVTIDTDNFCTQIVDNAASVKLYQDASYNAGTVVTASIEGYRVSGDRTARLELISRPGGTTLGTADLPTSGWGTRVSVSGTVAGGDTAVRLQIAYTGGSNSTTAKVRNAQVQTGSTATLFRCGSEVVGTDPATGGRLYGMYVQGNAPTRGRFTFAPNTGSSVVELKLSKRVVGNLPEFANSVHFQQSSEFSTGNGSSTVGSDASASGSSKVRCGFSSASEPEMLERFRGTITVTDPDSLRGTFKFFARMKFDYAPRYRIRLHWGPSVTVTPAFVCDRITIEPDTATTGWVLVELGTITLDQRSSNLSWAVHASLQLSGSGNPDETNPGAANMDTDYIMLVPTGPIGVPTSDEHVILSVKGWRDEIGANRRRWRGDELVAPTWASGGGGQDGDYSYVQALNHVRVTPPRTGTILSAGRYYVTAMLTITHKPGDHGGRGSRRKVGELRLVGASGSLYAKKSITIPDQVARSRHKTKLSFDITADGVPRAYAIQQTALDDVDIKIHHITERFQRALNSGESFIYNGEYGFAGGPPNSYLGTIEPVYQEGPFFELNPGPNLILVDALDVINPKNEDLDPRQPTGISSIGRTITVTAQHYPRWFA